MRVHADAGERELAHAGFRDDDRAGGAQPLHHGRIGFGGRRIGKDFRASSRRLARNVEQVLDADDRAVEGPKRNAAFRPRVRRLGRGTRRVGVDREAGTRALSGRIGNAGERLFQTVARAHETTGSATTS